MLVGVLIRGLAGVLPGFRFKSDGSYRLQGSGCDKGSEGLLGLVQAPALARTI